MANKRMFSRRITGSDRFNLLSHGAQCLYFHFSMNADDEGFLNNAKSIMALLKSKQEDLRQLIETGYVLQVAPDVYVITHWFVNNQIQKDRFSPTIYVEEKKSLELVDKIWQYKEGAKYPALDTGLDTGLETQIDKVNKSRSVKSRLTSKGAPEKKPYGIGQNVFLTDEEYRKLCEQIPYIGKLIDDLSIYMGKSDANRKKYTDHYFTLLSWFRSREEEKKQPKQESFGDIADGLVNQGWDIEI